MAAGDDAGGVVRRGGSYVDRHVADGQATAASLRWIGLRTVQQHVGVQGKLARLQLDRDRLSIALRTVDMLVGCVFFFCPLLVQVGLAPLLKRRGSDGAPGDGHEEATQRTQ